MPAYEYQCQSCGNQFERRQKMSDPWIASCPQCGGPVKRLIGAGAGVISKGRESSAPPPSRCAMDGACCADEIGCAGGSCAYEP